MIPHAATTNAAGGNLALPPFTRRQFIGVGTVRTGVIADTLSRVMGDTLVIQIDPH